MNRFSRIALSTLALIGLAGVANAGIGAVGDAYLTGDSTGDVYQVRLDGTYVPGNFANNGGNFYFPQNVFTNRSQGTAFPYLTTYGGPNNNFFVFDFSAGIQEVDGNTGASVFNYSSIVGSTSLGGDFASDGFLYAAGSGGVYKINTNPGMQGGSLLHPTPWGGNTLVTVYGDMYVTGWYATEIRVYSVSNPGAGFTVLTSNAGFPIQDMQARLTSNGFEFYASALYLNPSQNGIYKFDFSSGNFVMFSPADSTTTPGVTGPHGFNFGPDGHIYAAYQTGTVEVFSGTDGSFLYTLTDSGAKLTDVSFKPIPAPGAAALLGLAGLVAGRRRR
jgi:hypothetical protein